LARDACCHNHGGAARAIVTGIVAQRSASWERPAGTKARTGHNFKSAITKLGSSDWRGDSLRDATTVEVRDLRQENEGLKQLVAELSLVNLTLKKNLNKAPRAPTVRADEARA
jgi:hypothetical protein